MRFVDETQDVQDIYGIDDQPTEGHTLKGITSVAEGHESDTRQESSACFPSPRASVSPYSEKTQYRDRDLPPVPSHREAGVSTFPEPVGPLAAAPRAFKGLSSANSRSIPTDPHYCVDIESPLFPLEDEQEVILMRHYIDHMCRWVNTSSKSRHLSVSRQAGLLHQENSANI